MFTTRGSPRTTDPVTPITSNDATPRTPMQKSKGGKEDKKVSTKKEDPKNASLKRKNSVLSKISKKEVSAEPPKVKNKTYSKER